MKTGIYLHKGRLILIEKNHNGYAYSTQYGPVYGNLEYTLETGRKTESYQEEEKPQDRIKSISNLIDIISNSHYIGSLKVARTRQKKRKSPSGHFETTTTKNNERVGVINKNTRQILRLIAGMDHKNFSDLDILKFEQLVEQLEVRIKRSKQGKINKTLNPHISNDFLKTRFPIQNGKPLTRANWVKYCVWMGFDDNYIKTHYRKYLADLKKYKGSRKIHRYSVNTKHMN